jgi:hypothetical protein
MLTALCCSKLLLLSLSFSTYYSNLRRDSPLLRYPCDRGLLLLQVLLVFISRGIEDYRDINLGVSRLYILRPIIILLAIS